MPQLQFLLTHFRRQVQETFTFSPVIANERTWQEMYLEATGHPPYCNQPGPTVDGFILICCRYENHQGMHLHDRGGWNGRIETRWA